MDLDFIKLKYPWTGKVEAYRWGSETHSTVPYGTSLAEAIASHLVHKQEICYRHRDYCGVGLCYRKDPTQPNTGAFYYDLVSDGQFEFEYPLSMNAPIPPLARFTSQKSFVSWLANQSDESLCGREIFNSFFVNNQRITRSRLLAALEEV